MRQGTEPTPKLSAASKRALGYTRGPEWFCQFKVADLGGDFGYEEGVIRRDPSAVIQVRDTHHVWHTHHVWYTKGKGRQQGSGRAIPPRRSFPGT